ncbi:alkaline shock response membrane anchor protein AmaP [Corynebacterium sp.]|uniref:alkaline shock response membrane anchor protein AmaP n=1 Tax=Corynebacterium sp. TaxID=1720 RepID=UPI0026DBCDEF|nr:alkaline shock response membrane anchor protein AmaP [Corynebacterium sp.]MDO5032362.1 alkaline shock response membrane anchor protein AmaP [Corynebacterium sp.]
MSKTLAGLDRTLLAVLGLLLIAGGLWPILAYFDVPFAESAAKWINHDAWGRVPQAGWWAYALAGATLLIAVSGLWLIISNLKHNRFSTVESAASNKEGTISTDMAAIAGAIAQTLEQLDGVDKVKTLVAYDRARPTLQYVLTANPDTPMQEIVERIESNEHSFRAAFPDADLDTVYKLHYTKVQTLKA